MDVSTDTPYVDTISDGLQEGLQNPPNPEIPPVSTYSRVCFRPCQTPDRPDPSLDGLPAARYTGILLPGTTFNRYPVTESLV